MMARTQISTSCSEETRRQVDALTRAGGYTLRDIVTLGVDHLYNDFRKAHQSRPQFAVWEPDLERKVTGVLLSRGDEARVIINAGSGAPGRGPAFTDLVMLDEEHFAWRLAYSRLDGSLYGPLDWEIESKEELDDILDISRDWEMSNYWDNEEAPEEETTQDDA